MGRARAGVRAAAISHAVISMGSDLLLAVAVTATTKKPLEREKGEGRRRKEGVGKVKWNGGTGDRVTLPKGGARSAAAAAADDDDRSSPNRVQLGQIPALAASH